MICPVALRQMKTAFAPVVGLDHAACSAGVEDGVRQGAVAERTAISNCAHAHRGDVFGLEFLPSAGVPVVSVRRARHHYVLDIAVIGPERVADLVQYGVEETFLTARWSGWAPPHTLPDTAATVPCCEGFGSAV